MDTSPFFIKHYSNDKLSLEDPMRISLSGKTTTMKIINPLVKAITHTKPKKSCNKNTRISFYAGSQKPS